MSTANEGKAMHVAVLRVTKAPVVPGAPPEVKTVTDPLLPSPLPVIDCNSSLPVQVYDRDTGGLRAPSAAEKVEILDRVKALLG